LLESNLTFWNGPHTWASTPNLKAKDEEILLLLLWEEFENRSFILFLMRDIYACALQIQLENFGKCLLTIG